MSFLLGCLICSTIILHTHIVQSGSQSSIQTPSKLPNRKISPINAPPIVHTNVDIKNQNSSANTANASTGMQGLRVLVCLASYDFGQFALMEEVLDSYQDFCIAGAKIDIYVHTAIPYTVGLIDLMNARLSCEGMTITIAVQSPAVRLNLVDKHRELFYEKIDDYDLFIYSEDDIKVSPTTAFAYLQETKQVEELTGKSPAEDYNVGIVRYEYNYPPDVIIDDKTRHATEKVTRVYWEHLWKPLFPKSIDVVHQEEVKKRYVSMQNHHQGMFMATKDLLLAWKNRKGCEFNVIRQRPGKKNQPGQPTEGTQRVWMSSQMLHGGRHCNVQQLIPMKNFGQLTVWHLPNKNYRRVGKQGRIGGGKNENQFGTGKEKFAGPDASLPTEIDLHLQMRKLYPILATEKYRGIRMIDEVDRKRRFNKVAGGFQEYMVKLDERMTAYDAYAERGGILSADDFDKWEWTSQPDTR